MKIIIIDHEPLSSTRKKNFFIDKFIQDGFDIEFWCVQQILDYSKNAVYSDKDYEHYKRNFTSKNDFKSFLNNVDATNTIFFVELWFRVESLFIFKLLFKYKFRWMIIAYYINPVDNFLEIIHKNQIFKRNSFNLKFIRKVNIHTIKSKLFNIRYKKIKAKFYKPNVLFYTGNNPVDIPADKRVSINYFDVENYHLALIEEPIINQPYIVFTDIYLTNHPDLQILGGINYIDEKKYHHKMSKFFDYIEEKFMMPVVIAEHPKANYINEFGERKYYKNSTANLVINSKMVISHTSLSVSYSLLSKKPTIQIYTNEFLETPILLYLMNVMKGVTFLSRIPAINIDDSKSISILDKINLYSRNFDTESYEEVLIKFFLSDSTESNYFKVFGEVKNQFEIAKYGCRK